MNCRVQKYCMICIIFITSWENVYLISQIYVYLITQIMHYVSLDFTVYCLLEVKGLSWELACAIAKRRLHWVELGMFRALKTGYRQNEGKRFTNSRGSFCTLPTTTHKAVSSLRSGSLLRDGQGMSTHR